MKRLKRPMMSVTLAFVLTALLAAACQGSGAGSSSPSAKPTGTAVQAVQSGVHVVPSDCSASIPCRLTAGTYQLGQGSVLPGLEVTVPPGWTTNEVTPGEVNLVPPTPQNVELDFWLDLVAVKSSGAGHGTTILKNVAGTPDALTRWLTRNPDFLIVSKPRSVVIGHGIAMTSLTIGISRSVNYGDPRCPDNP